MRTLIVKLMLLLLPIGAIIITVNFKIDPANLFAGEQYVDGIAEIISKGHNVDNVSNYDERLLQKALIEKVEGKINVVVLGSSRVMEIRADFLGIDNFYNLGVSHANANDLIAITGILDSFNSLPKQVLIGVDPYLIGLQTGNNLLEWKSIQPFHKYLTRKLGINTNYDPAYFNNWNKFNAIISFEYFKQSLLYSLKGSSKKYTDVGLSKPENSGRFSDGSICYNYSYSHPDTSFVAEVATATAKKGLFAVDEHKLFLLEALLDYLNSKGIQSTLIMIPFHHNFYNEVNRNFKDNFISYSELFEKIAQKHKLKIVGNFNPEVCKMKESDFYDLYHCSGSSIKRAFFESINTGGKSF